MSASVATGARAETREGDRAFTTRGVATFTALVALLAILSDAAVGHALLWENDPYWTYWITKTFLIATVFGLGTAWLGTGHNRSRPGTRKAARMKPRELLTGFPGHPTRPPPTDSTIGIA